MVRKDLKRRLGAVEDEASGEGAHYHMGSGRDLLGATEDLFEPVALAAVIAQDEALLPHAGGRPKGRSQPGHVAVDDGRRCARQLEGVV